MTRFRFRLERLARVRAIEEQVAREAWSVAERGARAADERAAAALHEVEIAFGSLRALLAGGRIVPAELLARQALLGPLQERRSAALERARGARARAETQRAAWITEKRKLEGLERLETRDREAWRGAESVREAAAMDEVAAVRAARKARAQSAEEEHTPRSAE